MSKGKPSSNSGDKSWEISEPKLLKEKINKKFSDTDDQQQMKRIIRYLKRWKDYKFSNTENGKPTGIALTALAYQLFQPEIERNAFDSSVKPKDLIALKNLVAYIINQFDYFTNRISTKLPVQPYNNLFEKMTDAQQKTLKENFENLKSSLQNAENEPDLHKASKILIKVFGEDFPEVEKDKSGQKRTLAFPGKSESA